jgi:hypothetical protein
MALRKASSTRNDSDGTAIRAQREIAAARRGCYGSWPGVAFSWLPQAAGSVPVRPGVAAEKMRQPWALSRNACGVGPCPAGRFVGDAQTKEGDANAPQSRAAPECFAGGASFTSLSLAIGKATQRGLQGGAMLEKILQGTGCCGAIQFTIGAHGNYRRTRTHAEEPNLCQ